MSRDLDAELRALLATLTTAARAALTAFARELPDHDRATLRASLLADPALVVQQRALRDLLTLLEQHTPTHVLLGLVKAKAAPPPPAAPAFEGHRETGDVGSCWIMWSVGIVGRGHVYHPCSGSPHAALLRNGQYHLPSATLAEFKRGVKHWATPSTDAARPDPRS